MVENYTTGSTCAFEDCMKHLSCIIPSTPHQTLRDVYYSHSHFTEKKPLSMVTGRGLSSSPFGPLHRTA